LQFLELDIKLLLLKSFNVTGKGAYYLEVLCVKDDKDQGVAKLSLIQAHAVLIDHLLSCLFFHFDLEQILKSDFR